MFFAAGLATFLQSLIGCRLPIMQGASFTFVTPGIFLFKKHKNATRPNYKVFVNAEQP